MTPTGRTVRLTEAANPATLPARLAEIAEAPTTKPIQAAVARNPNTPRRTLLALAGRCWQEFLANPVLPLLLLEDPGLFSRLPVRLLRALVRREDTPPYILQMLARHDDREVREGAKYHAQAPGRATTTDEPEWRAALEQELRRLVVTHGNLPEALSLHLVPDWLLPTVAGTHNYRLRTALMKASHAPEASGALQQTGGLLRRAIGERQQVRRFTQYGAYWDGTTVGKENLTDADLTRLAAGNPAWQVVAARAPNLPADLMARLARGTNPKVWAALARHRRLTPEVAALLAARNDAHTLHLVALNRVTPGPLLATMVRAGGKEIRAAVGRHRNTPPAVLTTLATDAKAEVRAAVAANPKVPEATLLALARDPDTAVRVALARNSGATNAVHELLVTDTEVEVREQLGRSRSTAKAIHLRLLADPDPAVRHDAAYNYRTPRRLLDFVNSHAAVPFAEWPPLPEWKASDTGWTNRKTGSRLSPADKAKRSVVYSRKATPEELAEWAQSESAALRRPVAWYLTDPALLAKLAQDKKAIRAAVAHNDQTPPALLAQLATDRKATVRLSVASNKATPIASLRQLAADPKRRVRLALVGNENVPPELLADLWANDIPHARRRQQHDTLLRNPRLPLPILLDQLATGNADVRSTVAGNHALPVEELRRLATDASDAVRASVARNPRTPTDALLALYAQDGKVHASSLAAHPNLTTDLLRRLATDDIGYAMSQLVLHPLCTAELLAELLPLISSDDARRRMLDGYGHDRAPAYVYELLFEEGRLEIIDHLAYSEKTPPAILLTIARSPPAGKRFEDQMSWWVARNPGSTNEVLEAVFEQRLQAYAATGKKGIPFWFDSIAEHPNASPELLARLAQLAHASTYGRHNHRNHNALYDDTALRLVQNPRLAPEHLALFAEHVSREVRYAVLQRPDCPPELRTRMRALAVRRSLNTGGLLLDRVATLADPATSTHWLRYLHPQARWLERLAMTQNPNLPADLLETLTHDAHRLVRAAAQERQRTGRIPELSISNEQ